MRWTEVGVVVAVLAGVVGCGSDVGPPMTVFPCPSNQFVLDGACEQCPPGTENAPGDDPAGPDSSCDAFVCGQDEFVRDNRCVPCPEGSLNEAGDDASGADTQCESVLCGLDERVVDEACVPCPPGTSNMQGDDPTGRDTECDPVLCRGGQRVQMNECVDCEPGFDNESGDDASGPDTSCEPVFCDANERVLSNMCVPCTPGTGNLAGDDATGDDTVCDDSAADYVDCPAPNCAETVEPSGAKRYIYVIPPADHPVTDDAEGYCFGSYPGNDLIIEVDVTGFSQITVDTCRLTTFYSDSSVALYDQWPASPSATEIACSEDASYYNFCAQVEENNGGAPLPVAIPSGVNRMFVLVDEWDPGSYWDGYTRQTIDIRLIP